jgi:hypothetical protein
MRSSSIAPIPPRECYAEITGLHTRFECPSVQIHCVSVGGSSSRVRILHQDCARLERTRVHAFSTRAAPNALLFVLPFASPNANNSASTIDQVDARCFTGGMVHEPSRIDGPFSLGQYIRNIRMNFPAGAGSQFDSKSAPGESFWM